jgi:hypothetical protein
MGGGWPAAGHKGWGKERAVKASPKDSPCGEETPSSGASHKGPKSGTNGKILGRRLVKPMVILCAMGNGRPHGVLTNSKMAINCIMLSNFGPLCGASAHRRMAWGVQRGRRRPQAACPAMKWPYGRFRGGPPAVCRSRA